MIELFKRLFATQKIPYTNEFLERTIRESPFEPSLMSVSNILAKYNIAHPCVEFSNKEDLTEMYCPCFIVYGAEFALVERIENNVVALYTQKDGQSQIPRNEFMQKWNGIAMLVEADDYSGELYYEYRRQERKKHKLKSAVLLCGLLVLGGIAAAANPFAGSAQRMVDSYCEMLSRL